MSSECETAILDYEIISPEETARQIEALKWVRDQLVNGTIGHSNENGRHFNMDQSGQEGPCGTVACIGGWMWVYQNIPDVGENGKIKLTYPQLKAMESYVFDRDDRLDFLFFPKRNNGDGLSVRNWSKITPEQAVKAIDNYLKDGVPSWETVIENVEDDD